MENTENINIDTGDLGGTIEMQLASKGKRIGGFLIDAILAAIVASIVGALFGGSKTMAGSGISWLISTAYLLLRDALPFTDGLSIGKKLMKIRAVRTDGSSLTGDWTTSIIRNVLFVIPILGLIEMFKFLLNETGERFGDSWAKTKVVDDPGA